MNDLLGNCTVCMFAAKSIFAGNNFESIHMYTLLIRT